MKYAALLRGINVGKAKRLGMADLKAIVESLGHRGVRTLLNSGNVVFEARESSVARLASALEKAIAARAGFHSNVLVVSSDVLSRIVDENPLAERMDNPSRLLVAFVRDPAALDTLTPLRGRDWTPEALAVGTSAAYFWCPDGILAGQLIEAAGRALGEQTTTRNWATVLKLLELMSTKR